MIVELVDAIRNVLPHDGIVVDETATEPYKVLPGRLYVWPDRIGAQQLNIEAEQEGFFEDSTLRVRILYTVANLGEQRTKTARREVSLQLDELATEAIAALWRSRSHPFWWHVIIEQVRPDVVRALDCRGVGLNVAFKLTEEATRARLGGSGS